MTTNHSARSVPGFGRRAVSSLAGLAVVASLASCTGGNDNPPFREVVGTRVLMSAVLDPAADVVWDSVGTILTADGVEEIQPRTDEEWLAVRNAAVALGEAGNLLMTPRRVREEGDWSLWALDLVDAGALAMQAAESRDPTALFDAGGQIYEACLGCHENYILPLTEGQ